MQNVLKNYDFIKKQQWIVYLFIAIAISFFYVPIHELGHVIVDWLSGIPAGMSYARDYTLNDQAKTVLGQLGGPIFTVVLAYIGIFFIYKRRFLLVAYPFSIIMCLDRIFVYLMFLFSINVKTLIYSRGLPGFDERIAAEMLKINLYTFFVIFQGLEIIGIILILFRLRYGLKRNLFIVLTPIIMLIPMVYIGFNIIEKNLFKEQFKLQFGVSNFPIHPVLLSVVVISFLLSLILFVKKIKGSTKKDYISVVEN